MLILLNFFLISKIKTFPHSSKKRCHQHQVKFRRKEGKSYNVMRGERKNINYAIKRILLSLLEIIFLINIFLFSFRWWWGNLQWGIYGCWAGTVIATHKKWFDDDFLSLFYVDEILIYFKLALEIIILRDQCLMSIIIRRREIDMNYERKNENI